MRSHTNLWSGDSRRGDPATAPRRPRRPPRPPAPTPPPRSRFPRRLVAIGSAIAAVGCALLIGLSLGEADNATERDDEPPVLSGRGGNDVGRVYAEAGPAVVAVQVRQSRGTASGTGFVVDREGTVVTNAHVVGDADRARVQFDDNRRRLGAEVLGTDPSSDLAVLKVNPDAVSAIQPLRLANSDQVDVGDGVVAIGHPFGLDRTATAGIVSGLEREIQSPNGFQIDEVIQTDAPINPGNSGGPLLDARGRVIGVNSQIATAGAQGSVGIGFAVPSNTVRDVVPKLRNGETIKRPYLGVTTSPAPGSGAAVESVAPGGPGARAGLRDGARGDVIVGIEGRPVRGPEDVSKAIEDREPGDSVEVTVERDGRRVSLDVELGERPRSSPQGP